jgi:phosphate transport system protein
MDHTLKAVDEELSTLAQNVAAMGDVASTQVRAALEVFLTHDQVAAAKVVRADDALDLQEAEIEKLAVRFIALRQPLADDLRRTVAAMKIASQLERIGDLAKNIGKRVGAMQGPPPGDQVGPLGELGGLAVERLVAVVDAYRRNDAQGAYTVWLKDTDIDELHNGVLRDLMATMATAPDSVADYTHLLFIAKNLERIGDHATNIAELVHYQLTGADLADRPKL